jgi:hypothetical protein
MTEDWTGSYEDIWYESRDGLKLYARDYPGPETARCCRCCACTA